jgi:hypothetical protein
MNAIGRSLLLVIAIAVASGGCATVSHDSQNHGAATTVDKTCSFDAQCPGGSCRLGTCSPFPPDPPSCVLDSDCLGGSCRLGTCSTRPPDGACSFDSQCGFGSCVAGSCSASPPSTPSAP